MCMERGVWRRVCVWRRMCVLRGMCRVWRGACGDVCVERDSGE